MSQPLLSIHIPFTEDRKFDAVKLNEEFARQQLKYGLGGQLEIIMDGTEKHISIGEKRHMMYHRSNGIYSVQWDSDDWVAENGLKLIIDAAKEGEDCIGYEESVDIDGKIGRSNFSLDYAGWDGDGNSIFDDGFHYHRTPFFKTPIKTEICKLVGVKDMRFGEDNDFADRIKPYLKTQTYIPQVIYYYIHRSTNSTERYGFDR